MDSRVGPKGSRPRTQIPKELLGAGFGQVTKFPNLKRKAASTWVSVGVTGGCATMTGESSATTRNSAMQAAGGRHARVVKWVLNLITVVFWRTVRLARTGPSQFHIDTAFDPDECDVHAVSRGIGSKFNMVRLQQVAADEREIEV